jgi:hypothetical protein
MEISDLTIRLVILIIPGIIATLIVEALTIHKKWSSFQFIVYAILLGFTSYILYQLLLYLIALIRTITSCQFYTPKTINFWTSLFDKTVPISVKEVIITCLFSILLGFGVTAFIQHKVLSRIAKKIGVSYKYGGENLYTHFLNSEEVQWVWIRDKNTGLTYEGNVETFSENDTIQEIKLSDVKVFYSEDSTQLYEVSKIYLAGPPGQFTIEIPKETGDTENGEEAN